MVNITEQENLLISIGRELKEQITAYAIGGTAMMFHGLKDATQDIDLVFTSRKYLDIFKQATKSSGFTFYNPLSVYKKNPNLPMMIIRSKDERLDLFINEIVHFIFSQEMVNRATATHEFGKNLIVKIADLHDIILLKCATDRVKDKDDARAIIDNFKINWDTIILEAQNQVRLGRGRAVWELMGFVMELKKIGVKIPSSVSEKLLEEFEE